eukprot:XP_001708105.1 Hypothetical protein GL50803_31465 [Giardia lamblia ATCC 50803]
MLGSIHLHLLSANLFTVDGDIAIWVDALYPFLHNVHLVLTNGLCCSYYLAINVRYLNNILIDKYNSPYSTPGKHFRCEPSNSTYTHNHDNSLLECVECIFPFAEDKSLENILWSVSSYWGVSFDSGLRRIGSWIHFSLREKIPHHSLHLPGISVDLIRG